MLRTYIFFTCNLIAALAAPALITAPTHVAIHEPTLAKVGDLIENVPTAVSHQSSTIVHSRGQRVTPILTPAVRSFTTPALRAFIEHSPFVPMRWPFGFGAAEAYVPQFGLRSMGGLPYYSNFDYGIGVPFMFGSTVYKQKK